MTESNVQIIHAYSVTTDRHSFLEVRVSAKGRKIAWELEHTCGPVPWLENYVGELSSHETLEGCSLGHTSPVEETAD